MNFTHFVGKKTKKHSRLSITNYKYVICFRCGRSKMYNSTTEVCINDMCVRDKELHERYPEFCGDNMNLCSKEERWYHSDEKQCCADKVYGPGETCCSGKITPTPGTQLDEGACCNGIAYNPNTHMCCRVELHNITANEGRIALSFEV